MGGKSYDLIRSNGSFKYFNSANRISINSIQVIFAYMYSITEGNKLVIIVNN